MILIFLIVILFVLGFWFFVHRDPKRKIIPFEGYLSPADGVVVDIYNKTSSSEFIQKGNHGIKAFLDDFPEGKIILVIMMNFWHVHVQRAPAGGTVRKIVHRFGTFKNAVFGDFRKATIENEHLAINVGGENPAKIYLIAGILARGIKSLVSEGDRVRQGDRISKISFGSQVAIVLPESKILVKVGDKVKAGVTKLAEEV